MSTDWPTPVRKFEDIWTTIEPERLVYELDNYLSHKRHVRKLPLSQAERGFLLLASMQSWIEMEGFQDLFYQQYNLSDCVLVERVMREIGVERLADLFTEAKGIYVRHRTNLTEEEFKKLEPFDLPEADVARFDEIAEAVYASGSELFLLADGLAKYAQNHREEFSA